MYPSTAGHPGAPHWRPLPALACGPPWILCMAGGAWRCWGHQGRPDDLGLGVFGGAGNPWGLQGPCIAWSCRCLEGLVTPRTPTLLGAGGVWRNRGHPRLLHGSGCLKGPGTPRILCHGSLGLGVPKGARDEHRPPAWLGAGGPQWNQRQPRSPIMVQDWGSSEGWRPQGPHSMAGGWGCCTPRRGWGAMPPPHLPPAPPALWQNS